MYVSQEQCGVQSITYSPNPLPVHVTPGPQLPSIDTVGGCDLRDTNVIVKQYRLVQLSLIYVLHFAAARM